MVLNTEPAIEYNAVLDSQAARQPVPLIKRGDTISVMDCQDGMTVVALISERLHARACSL